MKKQKFFALGALALAVSQAGYAETGGVAGGQGYFDDD